MSSLQHNLLHQAVPVTVHSGGRERQHHVPKTNLLRAGQLLQVVHHSHREPGQVVLADIVH